jgi:purine catabolism regulator
MPLLLEHLLDDPSLGLVLVAGHAGLKERRPLRWAHISEIPDPTPWLEGGEILLTTGLAVKDDPALQRRLVARLRDRDCAGLGFGVGIWVDEVPAALAEEAEARQLPLFTVPYEVPFIAVTKRVMRHVAAEHFATLRAAVDLHRQVLAAVISAHGVQAVLETIARPMTEFSSAVFDYYGQLLALHDPSGRLATLGTDALWKAVYPGRHEHARFELALSGQVVSGALVRVGEEIEAVFALVGPRALHEHEALLMEQGLAGVSLELARDASIRSAHRARVEEVLDDVGAGRVGRRELERRLRTLGFDPGAGLQVLCVTQPDGVAGRAVCGLVEDVIGSVGAPVIGRLDGTVYAVVRPVDAGQAERLVVAARGRGWPGLVVGRSNVHTEAEGLAAALKEAATAAATPAPTPVRDVADLGLPGLLAGIADPAAVGAFVDQVLGPVLDHDRRESTSLTETLRAYLRHGCRPGPAAVELCVHRHTLAYRLDRIRDLTGRDPRDGAHLLAYGLALELRPEPAGGQP